MALPATNIFEVRATGSDTANSGAFDPSVTSPGTDFSQQDAAQVSYSDLVIGGTTTQLTSAAHPFGATHVGNTIQITGGTGFTTGFYSVRSVSGTTATMDRAVGTAASTGGVGGLGGALASPGMAQSARVAGNTVWWKGAFTITSASSNVSGGVVNFNLSGTQSAWNRTYGYSVTRGDNVRATLTLNAGLAATVLTTNNANSYNEIRNVAVVGNATSAAAAVSHTGRSNRITNLKVSAFTGGSAHLVLVNTNATLENFEISGGATANFAALNIGSNGAIIERGWVHGNAGVGASVGNSAAVMLHRLVVSDLTTTNGIAFQFAGAQEAILSECVADNNASDNYKLTNTNVSILLRRCISTRAGGYDFNNNSAADAISLDGCKTYSATSGQYPVTPTTLLNHTVLSALPYAGSGDYATNATAGAGASARSIPYALPGGTSTSYEDAGVSQHQDAGGLRRLGMSGGIIP